MRKAIILSSIILVFSLFFSCKKKSTDPPPPNSTSSTSIPTIGYISTSYMYFDQVSAGGGITFDSTVSARFVESQSSSIAVNAGTVTLNGVALDNNSNSYSQPLSPLINIRNVQNWNVTGSGTLSAFSYSLAPSYAKYTGGNLLPDTCTKTSGITINISGVTNSPSLPLMPAPIIVEVMQGSVFMYKTLNTSSGTINFSPTEIAGMTTGSFFYIIVNFQNYKLQTFGSVGHQFNTSVMYMKYTYLK